MSYDDLEQNSVVTMLKRAMALQRANNLVDAENLYRQVLCQSAHHFDALYCLGMIKSQTGQHAAAIEFMEAAVKSNPDSAIAILGLGNACFAMGKLELALNNFDRALALHPRFPEALYSRANVLMALGRIIEAAESYARALAVAPDWPEALTNYGNALHELGRYAEALKSYDRAIVHMPSVAMLHSNRANVLRDMRRWAEALTSADRALAIEPRYVDALINRGNILQDLERYEDALAAFDLALSLAPDHLAALNNRANVLRDLHRHEQAAKTVTRLLELAPDWDYARGLLLQSLRYSCDWNDYERIVTRIEKDVRAGKKAEFPFAFLAVSDSAADQLRCAQSYVADKYPPSTAHLWTGQRYRHDKIRVAYLSADFREHATSYLMAGLFERHDRNRFETLAFSFRPEEHSMTGRRVKAAFDRFVDVSRVKDHDIAAQMRDLEVDIAVDLMGFTVDSRTAIFANRPAPIQINYLGFPGTMGAGYMDYIIADRFIIPEDLQALYAEKVVYLPDCFQANDDQRRISETTPSRAEAGLPDAGLVFCSFNNVNKLSPTIFDVWMRLLQAVPQSVLWLATDNVPAQKNLRTVAVRLGVDPGRLIFAPRLPYADHLARCQLADLFLDTLPFNAGTTASDALWAGVPVLTCAGEAFASRMAGSLLQAVGLPELITHNLQEYEALAYKLASTRSMLTGIRARLAQGRATGPLFDTDRFRHHIEAAYVNMWERYQRGDKPESFAIEPVASGS